MGKLPYSNTEGARHSFGVELAEDLGMEVAVLVAHLAHWCRVNRGQDHNIHDGRAWSYWSRASLLKEMPYLSDRKIRTAIEKAVSAGILLVGNYNKRAGDKTNWYAFVDEDYWLGEGPKKPRKSAIGQNDQAPQQKALSLGHNDQPIGHNDQALPDTKPQILKNTKKTRKQQLDEEFSEFWKLYPSKEAEARAFEKFRAARGKTSFEDIMTRLRDHVEKHRKEQTPINYIPFASRWLSDTRWEAEYTREEKPRSAWDKGAHNGVLA